MLALLFLASTQAPLPVHATSTEAFTQLDGLLRFPLKGSLGTPLSTLKGRQAEAGLDKELSGVLYTIDITLGSPGQTVSVQFDTGSSETWVNPICAKSSNPTLCASSGAFTESTTFVNLGTEGGVQYGAGYVNFVYGYDYMTIGREMRLEPSGPPGHAV
jgi:hypothetical protein